MDKCIEEYIKQIITSLTCSEEEKDEIEDEMRDHLYLLVQEYTEEGYSEKEAAEKALQTFGQEKEIQKGFQKSFSPFHRWIQYSLWVSFFGYTLILIVELLVNRLYRRVNSDTNEYFIYLAGHIDSPSTIFNEEVFSLNTNFIPFENIYMCLSGQDKFNLDIIVHNTIGNVLLFIPIGVLFSLLLSKKKDNFRAFLFFLAFSLVIEVLQYVLRVGQFDIDDILLNTIGGVVGYFMGQLIKQSSIFVRRDASRVHFNK
ncbi:VanZ family protein [Pseudobacillus badius]|uniref:VanZ family protein n=1 Tax=Bacillus badius TaxID=1455 RepID=UPI003D34DCB0